MDQIQEWIKFWKTALILLGPWFDTLSLMQLKNKKSNVSHTRKIIQALRIMNKRLLNCIPLGR